MASSPYRLSTRNTPFLPVSVHPFLLFVNIQVSRFRLFFLLLSGDVHRFKELTKYTSTPSIFPRPVSIFGTLHNQM